MQKLITIAFFIAYSSAFSQKGSWDRFKLCIIKPDTAIIDKEFWIQRDSMETIYIRNYYAHLKELEALANFKDYPKEMERSLKESQSKAKKEVQIERQREPSVKKFRYYESIPYASVSAYNYYFNSSDHLTDITVIPSHQVGTDILVNLADSLGVDYLIYYSDLKTMQHGDSWFLKVTTSVYSRKEEKVILTNVTEGDRFNTGDMWICDGKLPLSCMFTNAVRLSTPEVFNAIRLKQVREK